MRSRRVEAMFTEFADLPRELVRVPWGERVRRAWRTRTVRRLFRSHELRVVWPKGNRYGVRITEYVSQLGTLDVRHENG